MLCIVVECSHKVLPSDYLCSSPISNALSRRVAGFIPLRLNHRFPQFLRILYNIRTYCEITDIKVNTERAYGCLLPAFGLFSVSLTKNFGSWINDPCINQKFPYVTVSTNWLTVKYHTEPLRPRFRQFHKITNRETRHYIATRYGRLIR